MNKNGWGLRMELVFILIFAICLLIATLGLSKFNLLGSDNDDKINILSNDDFEYYSLENKLNEAAKEYYKDKYNSDDLVVIKSQTLINNGYLKELKDGYNKDCKGYTKVVNNGVFVSYVDCRYYRTSGYDKDYE